MTGTKALAAQQGGGSLPSAMTSWPERSMPSKLSRAAEWLRDGVWPPDISAADIDRASASALRDRLIDGLRAAPPKSILTSLMTLMLHFPRPEFSQGQAKAVCLDMVQDFAEIPLDIFDAACGDWRRTQKWFPRPAELLTKANSLLATRKAALRDVERVLAAIDRPGQRVQGDNFEEADRRGAEALRAYLEGLKGRIEAEETAKRDAEQSA